MSAGGQNQVVQANPRISRPLEKTVRSWAHSSHGRRGRAQPSGNDADVRRVIIQCSARQGNQRVEIDAGQEVLFGRRLSSGQCIPSDRCMSNTHFSVRCDSAAVVLTDQGSTNGTFVNGRRIQRARLHEGDQIIAGTTIFSVDLVYQT